MDNQFEMSFSGRNFVFDEVSDTEPEAWSEPEMLRSNIVGETLNSVFPKGEVEGVLAEGSELQHELISGDCSSQVVPDSLMLCYVELQYQKLFLYPSVKIGNDESQLFMQLKMLLEFVKKNPPIRVLQMVCINDILEVDCYVKINMRKYGIENVRGGSYSMEILPEHFIKSIEFEFVDDITLRQQILNDVILKYNNIYNIDTKSEITKIQTNLQNYKDMKIKYENVNKYNGQIIDRNTLNDLEWIMSYYSFISGRNKTAKQEDKVPYTEPEEWSEGVLAEGSEKQNEQDKTKTKTKISIEDNKRYKSCLLQINAINYIFNKYIRPESFVSVNYSENSIFLRHPEFILDTIFYHSRHIKDWSNMFTEIKAFISNIEYMAFCIINRSEEYMFGLSTYPSNIEIQSELSIKYLNVYRTVP